MVDGAGFIVLLVDGSGFVILLFDGAGFVVLQVDGAGFVVLLVDGAGLVFCWLTVLALCSIGLCSGWRRWPKDGIWRVLICGTSCLGTRVLPSCLSLNVSGPRKCGGVQGIAAVFALRYPPPSLL